MKNDSFNLSLGQSQQLEFAFQRNGWTTEEVHELCKGDVLAQIKRSLFATWNDELVKDVFELKNLKALGFKRGLKIYALFGENWNKATLGDLVQLTETDILRCPFAGERDVEKINMVLEKRELRLGMIIPLKSRAAS